ncbi:MAG: FAD:protein FMN transferase, partial [Planctomycetales bacterium]|nr:FAD:protein FMN transferase [Planctomycetales bacterium]
MVDAERETPPPPIPERLLLSVARRAMACEFELLFNQFQYPAAADVAHEVLDLIEGLEGKLSVYKPRSDLSQLNRWGGKRLLPLSPDTLRLLQLARDLHRLTGGAFDVTAGALSEVWGFARRQGKMPSEAELATALQTVGTQYLQLDEAAGAAGLQREGVKVNPGGVGKGYALDRAAGRLVAAEINDFLIHGGLSSVVARGDRQHPETGGG